MSPRPSYLGTWNIWSLSKVCKHLNLILFQVVIFSLYVYAESMRWKMLYIEICRNKDKVVMNDQCGYLMRTKVSSSNEGGVAAGFAVLDSIYLT